MLSLYYGDGKGKTSCAIGVAVRFASKDKKVLFVDFIKQDNEAVTKALSTMYTVAVSSIPVELELTFDTAVDNKAHASKIYRELFDSAVRTVLTNKYDMLILDGVFDAISKGFLPESEVYEFLSNAPDSLDIICTGVEISEKFILLSNNATFISNSKAD